MEVLSKKNQTKLKILQRDAKQICDIYRKLRKEAKTICHKNKREMMKKEEASGKD